MRMLGLLAISSLILSSPALAAVTVTTSAGYWQEFEGTTDDNHGVCGVSTSDNLGRVLLIKNFDGGNALVVQVFKRSWQIPAGTDVPLQLTMNGYAPWKAVAKGEGTRVEFFVPGAKIPEFGQEFRRASTVILSFQGASEPVMNESLVGSNAVTTAMAGCVTRAIQARQTTQPFAAAPTQPFAPSASPAPTAPPAPPQATATMPPQPLPDSQQL